VIEEEEE